jgi:hypothetical protein
VASAAIPAGLAPIETCRWLRTLFYDGVSHLPKIFPLGIYSQTPAIASTKETSGIKHGIFRQY